METLNIIWSEHSHAPIMCSEVWTIKRCLRESLAVWSIEKRTSRLLENTTDQTQQQITGMDKAQTVTLLHWCITFRSRWGQEGGLEEQGGVHEGKWFKSTTDWEGVMRGGTVLTGKAKGAMAPRASAVSREERLHRLGRASVPWNTSRESRSHRARSLVTFKPEHQRTTKKSKRHKR